jgi:hypothetical protein
MKSGKIGQIKGGQAYNSVFEELGQAQKWKSRLIATKGKGGFYD